MFSYKVCFASIGFSAILLITACGSFHHAGADQPDLPSLIENAAVFNHHFTGFSIYDPAAQKTLYSFNEDKYFTPASNTKLFTLYTALSLLPDTLPALKYIIRGDSLIIKGTGDPTFLHPLWPDHPAVEFLKKSNKKLFMIEDALQDELLGDGWAWDDYSYDYQAEKSALPLYGNLVRIAYDSILKKHTVYPSYFGDTWSYLSNRGSKTYERSLTNNDFKIKVDRKRTTDIPFKTDAFTVQSLLADTLKHGVGLLWSTQIDGGTQWSQLAGVAADSVYGYMMKVSDNFIAEQLLLQTGAYVLDTLNTARAIDYAIKHLYQDAPDTLQWVDGSGLSRYNLFTPRTVVYVLNLIYQKLSMDKIKQIFARGGVSGTIQRWYGGKTPYIYAKTGSLSNNHALSGYLITQSGKTLIFSFMHSNYTGSVLPIRNEMQKVLEYIRDHY